MKANSSFLFACISGILLTLLGSCHSPSSTLNIIGSWRLVSGATITNGVSSDANYPKTVSQIKIINGSHFAFLRHDINPPKDSSNHFDAGGGSYTLAGDQYTEHLDYYAEKNWEGRPFQFTVSIDKDTLTQKGVEKVESEGVDQVIIERYVRMR